MRISRAHLIFVAVAAAYLGLFAVFGYAQDADNIAARSFEGSIYILIFGELARLGAGPVLPFVYAAVFAAIITGHIVRGEWERVLFFASPFVVVNACDIFNRFTLCIVCAAVLDWALRRRRWLVALAAGLTFASTHPFNAIFVVAAAAPMLAPLVAAGAAGVAQLASLDVLGPLFSDKRALLSAYGSDIAYMSQGNYAISPDLRAGAFGPLLWWLAVSLPGLGTRVSPLLAYGSAAYHALWLGGILLLSPWRRNLVFMMVSMSALVAVYIGNSAVGYRHLLPILYAALMLFSRSPPGAGRSFAFGLVGFGAGGGPGGSSAGQTGVRP